jgi:hypothetical protein
MFRGSAQLMRRSTAVREYWARVALVLGLRCKTESLPKEAAVMKTLGVILIVLGLIGLVWGGFTYYPEALLEGAEESAGS